MNQQATANREWLHAKMEQVGLKVKLIDRAAYIASALEPTAAPWFLSYASAYSDGHNNRGLRSRRLDHYARAYADMCEQIDLIIDLATFFRLWDAGAVFEGTDTEHWYFA